MISIIGIDYQAHDNQIINKLILGNSDNRKTIEYKMTAALPLDNKIFINPEEVKLVHSGTEYFTLLHNLIATAEHTIHLQTYIFEDDETGRAVAKALVQAAQRKVEVYLLVDGYASQRIPQHFIDELRNEKIHIHFFEPFFKGRNFYFGRRMHHKVFVADAKHALVAGMNVADRYNEIGGITAWMDFAVYVKGAVAYELDKACRQTSKAFYSNLPPALPQKPCSGDYPSTRALSHVEVRRNDWVRHRNEISSGYISMFRHARSEITIMCSYFLPGEVIRRLLRNAATRGVKIRVITAGPSDIWIAKQAERWLYDWLLRNKIDVYEYQPTVLHAKIALADNERITIGSYNINDLSAYASIELNLDIFDKVFAGQVKEQLDDIIRKDCVLVTRRGSRYSSNLFIQFARWCSYRFLRIIFYLFTFYFKQNRKG